MILASGPQMLNADDAPAPPLGKIQFTDDVGAHLLRGLAHGDSLRILQLDQPRDGDPLVALIPLDPSGFGRVEAIQRLLALSAVDEAFEMVNEVPETLTAH